MSYQFDHNTHGFIEVKEATKFQRFVYKRRYFGSLLFVLPFFIAVIVLFYFEVRSSTLAFEQNLRDRGVTFASPYPHLN
ncbi:MAG: hypothetical protein AB7S65_12510 [Sulfuricurvum sp.]